MQTNDTYNRGGLIAFLFSMAFSLVFFVYIVFINKGIDLKEVPEEAQSGGQAVAQTEVKKIDMAKVEKPWEPNEDVAAYGATVFKTNCTSCHGEKGMGDGVAAANINPPPRNLVEGKWKKGGTSIALYTTLLNGSEGTSMASFKHLPKSDRWALVQFIRSITKNKETDDAAKLEEFAKAAN